MGSNKKLRLFMGDFLSTLSQHSFAWSWNKDIFHYLKRYFVLSGEGIIF